MPDPEEELDAGTESDSGMEEDEGDSSEDVEEYDDEAYYEEGGVGYIAPSIPVGDGYFDPVARAERDARAIPDHMYLGNNGAGEQFIENTYDYVNNLANGGAPANNLPDGLQVDARRGTNLARAAATPPRQNADPTQVNYDTETQLLETSNSPTATPDALVRAQNPAPEVRGTPLTRQEFENQLRVGGEARLRAFSTMLGDDGLILGHLIFRVPPLAIRIKKGNIVYRWKPLRTNESIAAKSGNGECFIEMDLAFVGLDQINGSLAPLIQLFKKVPFAFIENKFIRNMMLPTNNVSSMAVCLETMIADAITGSPDTVWVTLLLRWFNYFPYSSNFYFRNSRQGNINMALTPEFLAREGSTGPVDEDNQVDDEPESDAERVLAEIRPSANRASVETEATNTPLQTERLTSPNILDLDGIRQPTALQNALPPEVRIPTFHEGSSDPADLSLAPTFPVVYPWNSAPYMDIFDSLKSISGWNDLVTFGWKKFHRSILPATFSPGTVGVQEIQGNSPERLPDTPSGPIEVSGDRTVVIWLGDSLMSGYAGYGNADPPTLHPMAAGRFNRNDNLQHYVYASWGKSTADFLRDSYWQPLENADELKVEGGEPLSKVLGVIISLGGNDMGQSTEDTDQSTEGNTAIKTFIKNLRRLYKKFTDKGVQVVQLSQAPRGYDWETGTKCGYSSIYIGGSRTREGRLNYVAEQVSGLCGGLVHPVLNYHLATHEGQPVVLPRHTAERGWCVPWAPNIRHPMHTDPTQYDIHLDGPKYASVGTYIYRHLPWINLGGQQVESTRYTVTEIVDGDTIKVEGITEEIRFQYIDTPETYQGVNTRWIPHGQDSWRPANRRWGKLAKEHLQSIIGRNMQVELELGELDEYRRRLAIVYVGRVCVNMKMVEDGYAFVREEYAGTETPRAGERRRQDQLAHEIWIKYEIARGRLPDESQGNRLNPRGMWGHRTVEELVTRAASRELEIPADMPDDVRASLMELGNPWEFRNFSGCGPNPTDPYPED